MRSLTPTAWRAGGLWVFAALLLMATGPRMALAQYPYDNVVFDGTTDTGPCGGCCLEFTDTINTSTSYIIIHLINDASGTDCIDRTCWDAQSTGGRTFTNYSDGGGGWYFKVASSYTNPMYTGPFPVIFNVYICGTYDCLKHYSRWQWSEDGGAMTPDSVLYIQACAPPPTGCPGCSYLTIAPDGTPYAHCGTLISFWNQTGASVGCFTLHIYPAIDWSAPCSEPRDDGVGCPLSPQYDHCFYLYPGCGGDGFTVTDTYNGDGSCDLTFCGGEDCGITSCSDPFSVFIPYCKTMQPRVIQLTDPPPGGGCDPDYTTIYTAFKETTPGNGKTKEDAAIQNFPNPVDAASGFKTTIPFVTTGPGIAEINIVNDKGVKVLRDQEQLFGAGTHFFYFTAKDLPTGTYYYTIEFPQGVVIASKTMLVVK